MYIFLFFIYRHGDIYNELLSRGNKDDKSIVIGKLQKLFFKIFSKITEKKLKKAINLCDYVKGIWKRG